MNIQSSVLSGLMLMLAVACAPAAKVQPGSANALEGKNGSGERDQRPRVLITSPLNGSTHLGANLRLTALISCQQAGTCATDPFGTRKLVAGKVKLRDERGRAIAVTAEAVAAPVATAGKATVAAVSINQYEATFVPATPLAAAAAYSVEVTSDGQAVVGFAGAPAAEESQAAGASDTRRTLHVAKISTSSEPLPTRVELAADPKKVVRSMRVAFSEPVSLATLASGGLSIVSDSGTTIEACPWSALHSACATENSSDVSDLVDFVFLTEVAPATLNAASLSVSTTVSGDGETVAEAAERRGIFAASTVYGERERERVLFSLKQSTWESCSASGDVRCVRNLKPR